MRNITDMIVKSFRHCKYNILRNVWKAHCSRPQMERKTYEVDRIEEPNAQLIHVCKRHPDPENK
jgi:hypothetical protein